MQVGEVFIAVRPDTKGFQSEADKSIGATVKNVAKTAAVTFGALAVGNIFKSAIAGARDLNETVSKSNTIFGSQAGAIDKWAGGAAKAIGQSKQQALDAAATFGNMFSQLGIGGPVTASMSKQMVELASDFASFHNADISDVLEAQQAAFRGEYDAVQRFVPTITAAAVEQRALADTHKKTTAELTAQDKALATQKLLMEGAGAATGDFARTSDSLANKQRTFGAEMDDLQAKLGNALLPAMTKLTDVVVDIVDGFNNLSPTGKVVVEVLGAMALAVAAVVAAVRIWTTVQAALNVVMGLNPIGLVVLAIAALVAAVVIAYQKSDTFRAIVDGAFRAVGAAAQFMKELVVGQVQFMVDKFLAAAEWILKGAAAAFGWVPGLGGKLKTAAKAIEGFRDDANRALDGIRDKTVTVTLDAVKAGAHIPGGFTGAGSQGSRQSGGPIPNTGNYLLHAGEYVLSPDIVSRIMRGAPSHGAEVFSPASPIATAVQTSDGGRAQPLVMQVLLDGKVLAEAAVDDIADALRRRDAALR